MKWLLAALLLISSVYALNSLSEMNVVVFPDIASQSFAYDFVFSDSSSCGVLLNVSTTITTNPSGRGNATLDLTGLTDTPSYLCTYRNGTLVNKQSLNPNAFEKGNITNNGLNGTTGYHVFQTSITALKTSNLSENQFALFYPNSFLAGFPFGTALLVNASTNRTGINNTQPTSTLDVNGNVSVSGNLVSFAGIFVNESPVGNVSGTGNAGNITYWIDNSTLGSIEIGPSHLNNTTTGVAGQIPMFASASQFAWTNKTNITIITATGATNWNKPVGAGYVTVFICGGGGSGGGGSAAAQGAVRSGGGGGGGGSCVMQTYNIADLTDPVSVTIGAGGAAVAGAADGNFGADSTFGSYITAYGGGGGAANAAGAGGGGGGGCAARGTSATAAAGQTGGACMIAAVAANTASVHGGGAGGGTAGAGVVNGPMSWISGAGGGTAGTTGVVNGGAGGGSQMSGAGGGGGGGVDAANPGTVRNGGAGGNTGRSVIAAGGGGAAGTGAGVCGGAGDGGAGTSGYFGKGGQGGGGGGSKSAAATSGCTGGTGGAFGGGGGGGGGGTNAGTGGGGGGGGDGGAIIIAW